jgi:hypothetical protein
VLREGGEKLWILNEDHQGAPPEKNIADHTATPEEARVDSDESEQEPGWVFSSGSLKEQQTIVPPVDKDRGWDFRILKNGVIEHFRTEDGRVVVRETGDPGQETQAGPRPRQRLEPPCCLWARIRMVALLLTLMESRTRKRSA